jgi:hypothetical protein
LLLFVGAQAEVVQTQVCRSQDGVLTTGEQWKAAMIEKGWITPNGSQALSTAVRRG